jgi:hypothetical protein
LNDSFMSIFWVSNALNKDETKCLTTRSRWSRKPESSV